MVKVFNQYFPSRVFFLIFTENVLIVFGVWIAVSIDIGSFRLALLIYPALLGKALLISGTCQFCLYFNDLYDLKSIGSRFELFVRLLKALGMASFVLAALYLLVPQTRFGSGIAETSALAVVLIVLLWRLFVERLSRAYTAAENILVVGAGPTAQTLVRQVRSRSDLSIQMMGLVSENGVEAGTATILGLPYLGRLEALGEIANKTKPDRIVIALEDRRGRMPVSPLLRLRLRGVPIEEASSLGEKLTGRIPLDSIRPSSLIFSDVLGRTSRSFLYRRIVGAVSSLVGLVVLSPLMGLIAIVIKLDSPGAVLYRQDRVGLDGKIFEMLKFRSMKTGAESDTGPVWASENDPRITRAGRVLRKLRLDELPQLINILRGEMNLIGPRPERPHFVEMLRSQLPFYDVRHVMRPGVTGWAQVSYSYGASLDEAKQKLEYDIFYLKNMSLSLDLLVIFETFKIALFGRGAR